jgi:hypothetical protein
LNCKGLFVPSTPIKVTQYHKNCLSQNVGFHVVFLLQGKMRKNGIFEIHCHSALFGVVKHHLSDILKQSFYAFRPQAELGNEVIFMTGGKNLFSSGVYLSAFGGTPSQRGHSQESRIPDALPAAGRPLSIRGHDTDVRERFLFALRRIGMTKTTGNVV